MKQCISRRNFSSTYAKDKVDLNRVISDAELLKVFELHRGRILPHTDGVHKYNREAKNQDDLI